jgi:hypothetical protein
VEFLGFLFSVWFVGFVTSSFYFWATKTNRSQAPVVRRLTGAAYGVIWPVFVVRYFTGRQQAKAEETERAAAERRILGGDPQ